MALTVVILGMHRSGTSCLANMLQQAGLYLGPALMGRAGSNLGGHAEALPAVHINDHILRLSGGAWDRVPEALATDDAIAPQMDAFLETLRAEPVHGWKDPRTTLTWPLWKPHLPECRLVACLRHPSAVARSLQVREGWPLERGLALWADYNDRLLQVLREEAVEPLWFDYDAPAEQFVATVEAVCRHLGLRYGPSVQEVYNPFLRHHEQPEPVTDPRIHKLYEELRERAAHHARAQWAGSSPRAAAESAPAAADVAVPAAVPVPTPALPDGVPLAVEILRHVLQQGALSGGPLDRLQAEAAEMRTRLGQLTQVHRHQNEVEQQLGRALEELRHSLGLLHADFRAQLGAPGLPSFPVLAQSHNELARLQGDLQARLQELVAELGRRHHDTEHHLASLRQLAQAGAERLQAEAERLRAEAGHRCEAGRELWRGQLEGCRRELEQKIVAGDRDAENRLAALGARFASAERELRDGLADLARTGHHQDRLLREELREELHAKGRSLEGRWQEARARLDYLDREADAFRAQLQALREALDDCGQFVGRVRGSLILRLRRRLLGWLRRRPEERPADLAVADEGPVSSRRAA